MKIQLIDEDEQLRKRPRPALGFRPLGLGGGEAAVAPPDPAPTVVITCAQSSPSATTPLNMTFTFSESVTGFVVGDITVGNGSAGNFAGAGAVYTCDVTPTAIGTVTVDVGAAVCVDGAGNANTAATQFTIFFGLENFTYSDGALPSPWTGATWTIAGNAALNTPTLGSELLTNGDMSSDTGWTIQTGWTIAAGVATKAPSAAQALLYQPVGTAEGWAQNIFTLSSYVAGAFRSAFGANVMPTAGVAANGTYTTTYRHSTSTGARCGVVGSLAGNGVVDNVSHKNLTLAQLFATLPSVSVASVTAQVIITVSPIHTQAGHVLNLDSVTTPQNFVIAYLDGANARLDKCVAGVYTNLTSGAVTFGATSNLKLVKSGDDYSLYYGAVGSETQVGTTQTISSMNGTIHGLFSTAPTPKFDTYQLSLTP